jgi:4-hydroxybenzoyl-CoA thioesterase
MSVFEHRRAIRFADMDPAGIVFYPRYFEMINETVEAWFREALGRGFDEMILKERFGVPLARIEVDFKTPGGLDDELVFRLTVERIGGASAALRIRALCGDEVRFEARLTIVYLDIDAHKPTPIPDALRARMTDYLEEVER